MIDSFEEDHHLLLKCFSGDRDARETFVRQFTNLVYQSVGHTLSDKRVEFGRFDLEDLHNTVFLRLLDGDCRKLRQYEGKNKCSLATWVKVVTVSIVLDHLRKKGIDSMSAQKSRAPVDEILHLATRESSALERMEEAEQKRLYDKAIQYLPPRDRLFVKLHLEKDISIQEVAGMMRLSLANAYTIKHRITHKIQLHIDSLLENDIEA